MSDKPIRMTIKLRKFLGHYLKHGNATAACKHAYNPTNDNSAAVHGHFLVRKLKIQISDMLDAQGATDEVIAKVYADGMKAVMPSFEKDEKGVFQPVGESPDHKVRIKAADSASKVKQHLSTDILLNLTEPLKVQIEGKYVPAKSGGAR